MQPPWEPPTAYPPELQRSSARIGGGVETLSHTSSNLPHWSEEELQERRNAEGQERRDSGDGDLSGSGGEEDSRRRFAASRLARINSLIRDRAASGCVQWSIPVGTDTVVYCAVLENHMQHLTDEFIGSFGGKQ